VKHVAYALIMATRPQTLYGLADSPVDLVASAIDHGDGTGQPGLVQQVLLGHLPGELTRDDILAHPRRHPRQHHALLADEHRGSSARLQWENKAGFFDAKNITIPFAITSFPTSFTRPRGVGQSARIPTTSSITTSSTEAATSRSGNSRNSFRTRFAPASDHCASSQQRSSHTYGAAPESFAGPDAQSRRPCFAPGSIISAPSASVPLRAKGRTKRRPLCLGEREPVPQLISCSLRMRTGAPPVRQQRAPLP
jgi:hypothetical protein